MSSCSKNFVRCFPQLSIGTLRLIIHCCINSPTENLLNGIEWLSEKSGLAGSGGILKVFLAPEGRPQGSVFYNQSISIKGKVIELEKENFKYLHTFQYLIIMTNGYVCSRRFTDLS